MKIGIDTFDCDGGKSGVGVYVINILKRIPPSSLPFELFGWSYDSFSFSEAVPDMEFVSRCSMIGNTANSMWHIFRYPGFAKKQTYNACFFPSAHRRLPGSSPCPTIGTVHDMAAFWGSRKNREHLGAFLRMVLPNSLRKLDRVIAVSNYVKQELIEIAGVKESKIDVVPNGIDLEAFHPSKRGDGNLSHTQPLSFRRPYILYVSRIDHPVKNHIRLIEAFNIFKERSKYPHRLVLAGSDKQGADLVKQAALKSTYGKDIFFTGYFSSEYLPGLYADADMAVFPSMYEGFGMGVLEAMASGVPVACARAASLPEAADHAALYFDPFDVEDMADRLVTLAANRDLYRDYKAKGLERAQNFSWDRCAEKTIQIIEETSS
jgi:glycosyltransferase involved in cell wall biosynthesis